MLNRTTLLSVVAAVTMLWPVGTSAFASSPAPTCSVDSMSPRVGQTLTFDATNLNSGGATKIEMISGTDGSYRYEWYIGNVSSYEFQWTYSAAGSYAAVFSKDTGGSAYRMKCSVNLVVTI
jgi:hypothetical protein